MAWRDLTQGVSVPGTARVTWARGPTVEITTCKILNVPSRSISDMCSSAFECGETALYHYEKFNVAYFEDILQNKRIHCSQPDNLNDPWDCRPFLDVKCLKNPLIRRDMAEWFLSMSNPPASLEDKIKDHLIKNDELTLRRALKSLTGNLCSIIPKNWRIYCLTPDPVSTLMWSHYAGNHRGICLEFAVAKNTMFGGARKVNYFSEYPEWQAHKIGEDNATAILLLSKAECSAHEREYRIIGALPNRRLSGY